MPMVVNTGVTNRNHTPGIYSAETTAGLPAPGSTYVWVLDKQAGILYVDNGTTLIPILINAGAGGPFLPLAGGTMTGPITGQDISATKFSSGASSALVATTGAGAGTLDNVLDLIAKSTFDGFFNQYTFRGQTPGPGGPSNNPIIQLRLDSGTIAYVGDLAIYAPLASPALTGVPIAPTAALGTNTTQLATTAFVLANAGGGAVSSVFTRTGAVVALVGDYAAFYLQLSGGTLTGNLTTNGNIKTTTNGSPASVSSGAIIGYSNSSTSKAIQLGFDAAGGYGWINAYITAVSWNNIVMQQNGGNLLIGTTTDNGNTFQVNGTASISGVITGPTAAPGTNNTQLATTAFVVTNAAGLVPYTGATANINLGTHGLLALFVETSTGDIVSGGNLAATGGGLSIVSAKTVVNGSVSGSVTWTQPFGTNLYGGSILEVVIYINALNGTASFSWSYGFTNNPNVSGDAAAVALFSALTTTSITFTGTGAVSGWVFLKGF